MDNTDTANKSAPGSISGPPPRRIIFPLGFLALFLIYACLYHLQNVSDPDPDPVVAGLEFSGAIPLESTAVPPPTAENGKTASLEPNPDNLEEDKPAPEEFHGTVNSGDSISGILASWLTRSEIHLIAQSSENIFHLNRIKQGRPYVVYTENEIFTAFEYEIDRDRKLVVARTDQGFSAAVEKIDYEIVLHRVQGEIRSNLFAAMAESGEKALLAAALADVFAWEINFIRDLRVGDSYALLVEKRYRNGEFKDYGKILAASFTNRGTAYEAFLFTDDAGRSQYFNRKGESLRRAFLKAPLAFSRISSGYSSRRLHPIHQIWRAHPAIDYAAPAGTPVKTVGNGTVAAMGYNKDAGNFVRISHMNKYETIYMHLSSFAGNLRVGGAVSQGQVIAFVGQTGSATGPHLDFRMKKNGSYVNPLKELTPRDNPVTEAERPRFMAVQESFRAFLEEKRNLAEYSRSMFN
ncbi:MAG: peptidoglycan DD-metalloendopeptidase family protein [Deltaproteobacteria bacterium]|nr:peptidoglycan DD-metalloendopeptidase family protein [Deltaproteobacteria bacterium]